MQIYHQDARCSISQCDEKVLIQIHREPVDEADVVVFMTCYKEFLEQLPKTGSYRALMDASRINVFNFQLMRVLFQHFVDIRPLSESRLSKFALVVSNKHVGSMVNMYLKMKPGQIRTHVSGDMEECKRFLRDGLTKSH
jgi:hypothetical protein